MFDIFLILLILLNVTAVILETVHSIYIKHKVSLHIFDIFSVSIFTVEYLLRLVVCTTNKKYEHPVFGRIKFALTPLALADIIAIAPFYLPMFFFRDMRFLRGFRLFRLTRVLSLGRYSRSLRTLSRVLIRKKEELIISILSTVLILLIFSSLMYYIENPAQPETFSSIPATMWWGVITLTTVGYGDIYPITTLGKICASIIAFLGIGLFALPAGILSSGFAEEIKLNKADNLVTCPHCGKKYKND